MTEDGYPTEEELQTIEQWPYEKGWKELMAYVASLWTYPNLFKIETSWDQSKYAISTGGWSGNGSIIDALYRNSLFWALCWKEATKGGHYVFIISKEYE